MAEATAKAGDQNMAGSEEGNTRRSNSAPRVDGRSLGIPAAVAARSDVGKECSGGADTDTKSEALARKAAAPPHYSSTTALLAHALLLGLGLGLLGCACVLLLPVLLLLLPRVLGRLGCLPRPRGHRRRTPSTSRRGLGPPHRRSKLMRVRIKYPPFWVCALALLVQYFNLVGAAPLTDTTFKQASWGKLYVNLRGWDVCRSHASILRTHACALPYARQPATHVFLPFCSKSFHFSTSPLSVHRLGPGPGRGDDHVGRHRRLGRQRCQGL